MEIILLKDVEKIGFKHDVVKVKNGYARNFLIPQGMAVIANANNNKKLESLKEKARAEELARVDEYKEIDAKINGQTLKIAVKAGTSGKIFGSVTNVQVGAVLKENFGIEIDRRKIVVPEDIKEIGTYEAVVNLHPEVTSKVNLELVQD